MPKFEKKFVHFMWDDELEGKNVFFGDDIHLLSKDVEDNKVRRKVLRLSSYPQCPFLISGYDEDYVWKFVYYDPHYDLKLAYEQGRVIQYRDGYGNWTDMDSCECVPEIEYRIKPDKPEAKPVTNRELARWLAQGNGEIRVGDIATHKQNYDVEDGEYPVSANTLIRKWEETEWHEPTREYMGLED